MIRSVLRSLLVAALLTLPAAAARAETLFGAADIAALVEQALAERAPGARHEVSVAGAPVLRAPEDTVAPVLVSLDYQARTGAFTAMLAPHPGGQVMRVTGRADEMTEMPAVARAIMTGERISPADIVWIETRASRLPADAILDPAELEGQEARRTLRPGAPLRRLDVKIPAVISKNEIVTVFYSRPGITLAARGRALEDATQGAALRILNLQSNRVIEATAEAPGRARVESPRLYAAAQGEAR